MCWKEDDGDEGKDQRCHKLDDFCRCITGIIKNRDKNVGKEKGAKMST